MQDQGFEVFECSLLIQFLSCCSSEELFLDSFSPSSPNERIKGACNPLSCGQCCNGIALVATINSTIFSFVCIPCFLIVHVCGLQIILGVHST